MKKIVSLLLSFCILIMMIPVTVSAEDTYTEGNFTYTVTDGKATITSFPFRINSAVTVPSSLGGFPVVAIGDNAFESCRFPSITLPDTVTSIGNNAFSDASITSLTIPGSVTTIGNNAFSNCSRLTTVTIPNNITSIGFGPFSGCSSLSSILVGSDHPSLSSVDGVLFNKDKTTLIQYPKGKSGTTYVIPDSTTSIGGEAFGGCSGLTSITIPNSVTSIGYNAFSSCTGLTSITIPESVTSIGDLAFHHCYNLSSITIPSSVISIGTYAFRDCWKLNSVTFEDGVASIGSFAFQDCSSLTSISIPKSVTSIGDYAFWGCPLTAISVNAANPAYSSLNRVLFNKDKTVLIQYPQGKSNTSYSIPNSVTTIENYAFRFCTNLTSVTIPDSVVSIGEGAFDLCSALTNVTMGSNVTSIGRYAFRFCSVLPSITIPKSVTSIRDRAFFSCDELDDVYYGGTKEEWERITIDTDNPYLTSATIHYAGTEEIPTEAPTPVPTAVPTEIPPEATFSWEADLSSATVYPNGNIISYREDTGLYMKNGYNRDSFYAQFSADPFCNALHPTTYTLTFTAKQTGGVSGNVWDGYSIQVLHDSLQNSTYFIHFVPTATGVDLHVNGDTGIKVASVDNGFHDYAITFDETNEKITSLKIDGTEKLSSAIDWTAPSFYDSIVIKYTFPSSNSGEFWINDFSIVSEGYVPSTDVPTTAPTKPPTTPESMFTYTVTNQNTVRITGFSSAFSGGDLVIPATLGGLPVTSIDNNAFQNQRTITSVTIPEGVTRISNDSFSDCSNLRSVTIPLSLKQIAYRAFRNCTYISNVYYAGNYAQWYQISIDTENSYLTNAKFHYNALTSVSGSLLDGTLTVTPEYIPTGSRISYAAYKGNRMVSFDTFIYNGTGQDFPITVDYDYIKLFAWNGLTPLIHPTEVR